jgi:hypothetical protein
MEKEIFDELPQFDRLVAGSRFEALAADEQAVVVKYMTPGGFNEMHDLAVAEKEETLRIRNAIGPLTDIKAKLMADLTAGKQSIGNEGVMASAPNGKSSRDSETNIPASAEDKPVIGKDRLIAGSPEGKSSPDTKSDMEGYPESKLFSVKGRVMTSGTESPSPVRSAPLMAGRPEGRKATMATGGSQVAYWFTRRIPLYQAAIAASLLIILLLAFLLPVKFNAPLLAVTDTVYLEKIVRVTDTVWLPDDRDDGSPGHSVSDPGTAGHKQGSSAGYRKGDTGQPGTPVVDARFQATDGLARVVPFAGSRKGDAHQPGTSGDYARRQMADALARIAPLASGRPGNSFPADADLIRLVTVQY